MKPRSSHHRALIWLVVLLPHLALLTPARAQAPAAPCPVVSADPFGLVFLALYGAGASPIPSNLAKTMSCGAQASPWATLDKIEKKKHTLAGETLNTGNRQKTLRGMTEKSITAGSTKPYLIVSIDAGSEKKIKYMSQIFYAVAKDSSFRLSRIHEQPGCGAKAGIESCIQAILVKAVEEAKRTIAPFPAPNEPIGSTISEAEKRLREKVAQLESDKSKLRADLGKAQEDLGKVDATLGQTKRDLDNANNTLKDQRARAEQIMGELAQTTGRLNEAQKDIADLGAESPKTSQRWLVWGGLVGLSFITTASLAIASFSPRSEHVVWLLPHECGDNRNLSCGQVLYPLAPAVYSAVALHGLSTAIAFGMEISWHKAAMARRARGDSYSPSPEVIRKIPAESPPAAPPSN